MQKNVSELTAETLGFLVARAKTVAIAALVFAMMFAVVSGFLTRQIEDSLTTVLAESNITTEQFYDVLLAELQKGPVAQQDLEVRMVEQMTGTVQGTHTEPTTEQKIILRFFLLIFPSTVVAMLLSFVIFLFAGSYYLVLSLKIDTHVATVARNTIFAFPRLVVLGFWSFIRSFFWIPILGPFIAIFLLPRLALAPAFLLVDQRGAFSAVAMSWRYSKGSAVKIFLSLLALILLCIGMSWLATLLSAFMSIEFPRLGFVLWMFLFQWVLAYAVVFQTRLSMTVIEHPIVKNVGKKGKRK